VGSHLNRRKYKKKCQKRKEEKKGDKMPRQKRIRGFLRKIPGKRKKVRIKPHLRKIRKHYK